MRVNSWEEFPIPRAYDVAVLIGSLRRDSINRKVAQGLMSVAPASLRPAVVEIGHLPLYKQDGDDDPPPGWVDFRQRIGAASAFLFVTPEHNRSVPAALKNGLDIASRPYGQSAWDGKPGAVASASPRAIGGFGANHHLRQSLVFLNVAMMPQPEAYIGGADKLFDSLGGLVSEATRDFFGTFVHAFADRIARNKKAG
jgi:chromate reductase